MINLENFLQLSLDERRKVKLRKKSKRRGAYRQRPSFSKEELVDYMVKNQIHSVSDLKSKRGNADPIVWDYVKTFSSWKEAKLAAFPALSLDMMIEQPSPHFLTTCVIQSNLWRKRDWLNARRKYPSIVPSVYWCEKIFGSWDNCRYAAERQSFRHAMDAALTLARKLGHPPTIAELTANGIDVSSLYRVSKDGRRVTAFLAGLWQIENSPAQIQKKFSDISLASA